MVELHEEGCSQAGGTGLTGECKDQVELTSWELERLTRGELG